MRGINLNRLLLGGVVVGVLLWFLEAAASMIYLDEMRMALQAHSLVLQMKSSTWLASLAGFLLFGLTLIFIYVAMRPRFGPGPKTAIIAAVALWLGGYVTSLIGYDQIALYPRSLLYLWGIVGLVQMIIGSIVGAWIYREG
jgi:hypothetical protein